MQTTRMSEITPDQHRLNTLQSTDLNTFKANNRLRAQYIIYPILAKKQDFMKAVYDKGIRLIYDNENATLINFLNEVNIDEIFEVIMYIRSNEEWNYFTETCSFIVNFLNVDEIFGTLIENFCKLFFRRSTHLKTCLLGIPIPRGYANPFYNANYDMRQKFEFLERQIIRICEFFNVFGIGYNERLLYVFHQRMYINHRMMQAIAYYVQKCVKKSIVFFLSLQEFPQETIEFEAERIVRDLYIKMLGDVIKNSENIQLYIIRMYMELDNDVKRVLSMCSNKTKIRTIKIYDVKSDQLTNTIHDLKMSVIIHKLQKVRNVEFFTNKLNIMNDIGLISSEVKNFPYNCMKKIARNFMDGSDLVHDFGLITGIIAACNFHEIIFIREIMLCIYFALRFEKIDVSRVENYCNHFDIHDTHKIERMKQYCETFKSIHKRTALLEDLYFEF